MRQEHNRPLQVLLEAHQYIPCYAPASSSA